MSQKEDLTGKVAELSMALGREINPETTVPALKKQVAELESEISGNNGADSGPVDTSVTTAEREELTNPAGEDSDHRVVRALKTIWTEFDGEQYRLNGGKSEAWPASLALEYSELGFVEIIK